MKKRIFLIAIVLMITGCYSRPKTIEKDACHVHTFRDVYHCHDYRMALNIAPDFASPAPTYPITTDWRKISRGEILKALSSKLYNQFIKGNILRISATGTAPKNGAKEEIRAYAKTDAINRGYKVLTEFVLIVRLDKSTTIKNFAQNDYKVRQKLAEFVRSAQVTHEEFQSDSIAIVEMELHNFFDELARIISNQEAIEK